MNKVNIFTLGGTIDKVYFDANSAYEIGSPNIDDLLKRYKVYFDYEINPLMHKDSLDMNDEDRQLIYLAVKKCKNKYILITHGTDTMAETAGLLSDISDKVIILTGAMLPAGFRDSDAEFNIGCALGALWSADSGVYIAMNGFVFSWRDVYKDRSAAQFKCLWK